MGGDSATTSVQTTERRASRSPVRVARPQAVVSAGVLTISVISCGLISIVLGQDANWDLKNYHIYNAYAFLESRLNVDFAPAQQQTYFNPLLDILVYFPMMQLPPRWFGFLLGGFHGVNAWLVFLIARQTLSPINDTTRTIVSVLCAVIGLYGAISFAEIGTTFHDLTTAVFVLFAILVLVSERPPWIAGLALGLGIGLKYTLVIYAAGFAVAILTYSKWSFKERIFQALAWGMAASCGLLASSGFWLLQMWQKFGNPLFPYFNNIFRSPHLAAEAVLDARFFPSSLARMLFYPFYFNIPGTVAEIPFQDLRMPIIYLLGVAVLICAVMRWALDKEIGQSMANLLAAKSLTVFFACSYIAWQMLFSIYRYLVPLELLAPVVIVILFGWLLANRAFALTASVAVLVLIGATVRASDWGRVGWGSQFVEVQIPNVPLSGSTIVMMSGNPTSYVAPSFPPDVRFVRIEGNFFAHLTQRGQQDITTMLALPASAIYVITSSDKVESGAVLLKRHSLRMINGSCQPLVTNLDRDLVFCQLDRET
jgi:hypothetical protein